VDTGVSVGLFNTDYLGISRPFDGIWDIGPYEYVSVPRRFLDIGSGSLLITPKAAGLDTILITPAN
jgi:hypothetical protein